MAGINYLESTNSEVSRVLFNALKLRGGAGIGLVVPWIQPVLIANEKADPVPVGFPRPARDQQPFWISYSKTGAANEDIVIGKSYGAVITSAVTTVPTGKKIVIQNFTCGAVSTATYTTIYKTPAGTFDRTTIVVQLLIPASSTTSYPTNTELNITFEAGDVIHIKATGIVGDGAICFLSGYMEDA